MKVAHEDSAKELMLRLKAEAERAKDLRRVGTLERLQEACDDILSGKAYAIAKSAKEDSGYFNPNFAKLNSKTIDRYVRLRDKLEKGKSPWKGPVATTIRGDRDLSAYVKLRAAQRGLPYRRSPRPLQAAVDQIIDGIADIQDQALLRETVIRGRQWKSQLDLLLKTLRQIPAIDIDAVAAGRADRAVAPGSSSSAALGLEGARVLRELVIRLKDNDFLEDFELIYRSGGVRMDGGTGLELIAADELRLLEQLAGFGGKKESSAGK